MHFSVYIKSVALPINLTPAELENNKLSFPFIWAKSSLSYLGIDLPGDYKLFFKSNISPVIVKLRQLFKTWSAYNISFLGKTTAIKMTILPKLLYLFCALPLMISKPYLLKIQAKLNTFIWQSKPPRFARGVL